jgi:hypothetical protein
MTNGLTGQSRRLEARCLWSTGLMDGPVAYPRKDLLPNNEKCDPAEQANQKGEPYADVCS